MRLIATGVIFALFINATSCSVGPIQSLNYKETAVRTSGNGIVVRIDRDPPMKGVFVVGQKKDLWGFSRGLVQLEQDPHAAVLENLLLELGDAKVAVRDSGPRLSLVLRQMYVEPSVGLYTTEFLAVTDADVVLEFSGGQTLRRRFVGMGLIGASSVLLYSDRLYTEALQASIRDFAKKSLPEIIRVCEQHLPGGETP